jgi:hypothetical protein
MESVREVEGGDTGAVYGDDQTARDMSLKYEALAREADNERLVLGAREGLKATCRDAWRALAIASGLYWRKFLSAPRWVHWLVCAWLLWSAWAHHATACETAEKITDVKTRMCHKWNNWRACCVRSERDPASGNMTCFEMHNYAEKPGDVWLVVDEDRSSRPEKWTREQCAEHQHCVPFSRAAILSRHYWSEVLKGPLWTQSIADVVFKSLVEAICSRVSASGQVLAEGIILFIRWVLATVASAYFVYNVMLPPWAQTLVLSGLSMLFPLGLRFLGWLLAYFSTRAPAGDSHTSSASGAAISLHPHPPSQTPPPYPLPSAPKQTPKNCFIRYPPLPPPVRPDR